MRQYSTTYWELPKKNGKSEIAAGVALYGLFIDEEQGAEVYSAAATRDQASIVFKVAAQMVRNQPALLERCRIIDSTKTIVLRDDPSSFYKAISADAGTQDGVNPHMVVFDELHRQKGREFWDVLEYGMATRSQPLMFAITTAGIASESPLCWDHHEYARQVRDGIFRDPSFYPVLYGLDEKEDWTLEGEPARGTKPATGWFKANPGLGDFKRLDLMRKDFQKALRLPAQQSSFRRFHLNEWGQQESRWISLADWDECGVPFNLADLAGKQCFAGLDLSSTKDITALVLLFPIEDLVFAVPYFWIPEEDLHERSIRDKVTYDLWASQGLIHLTPGKAVDYSFVRQTVNDLGKIYEIKELGYDPWNAAQIAIELQADGFTMVPTRQGFISMSAPSKEIERRVLGNKLRHGGNPILRWMMDCTSVAQDAAGNIKPVKPDRGKSSKRIDGIAAMATGFARFIVQPIETQSVYDTRGPLGIW